MFRLDYLPFRGHESSLNAMEMGFFFIFLNTITLT